MTTKQSSSTKHLDPSSIFQILSQLGKGSYGGVYKAIDNRSSETVALKIVPIETDNTKELFREIQILRKCNSKYIVNYLGSYRNNIHNEVWIALEYCGGGSVQDLIRINKKSLTEIELKFVIKSTLYALKYLHKNKLIHRDIKAGNILITNDGLVKLADFGVSSQLQKTISRRNTVIGSPFWMAPEVLSQTSYDFKADIWSLGITIIEMGEGQPPLADIHPLRALLQIPTRDAPKLQWTDEWSNDLHDFLSFCLNKNPKNRKKASQLLKHKWIKDFSNKKVIKQLLENSMEKIKLYRIKKEKERLANEKKKTEEEDDIKQESIHVHKDVQKHEEEEEYYSEEEGDTEYNNDTMLVIDGGNNNNNNNINDNESENEIINYDASTTVYNDDTMVVNNDSTIILKDTNKNSDNENIIIDYDNTTTHINEGQSSTMKINDNNNNNTSNIIGDDEDIDYRDPKYIITPVFTQGSPLYENVNMNNYLPKNGTKEQLTEFRTQIWSTYWKDKKLLSDYYVNAREQIFKYLEKVKKERRKKRNSSISQKKTKLISK